jgi:hypothetical protein
MAKALTPPTTPAGITDKERLDWCEKEMPNLLCLCEFGNTTVVPEEPDAKPTGYHWEINDKFVNKSLRSAIDTAMSAEAGKKEKGNKDA